MINKQMFWRVVRLVLLLVLGPLSLVVWSLYTFGCMAKTVAYLLLTDVEAAEDEIRSAFRYE